MHSYARNCGGIVLHNVEEGHKQLFDAAHDAISELLAKHLTIPPSKWCYDEELKLLEHATRIMMLVSLAALDLAERFYNQGNEQVVAVSSKLISLY